MNKSISVILVKSSSCPHCINFEPIYEISKNIYDSDDFLKKYDKINFENYDLKDDQIKEVFNLNHKEIKDKIKYYPTVYVNIQNNNKNNYLLIEPTIVNEKINKDDEKIKDASDRFIINIVNCIKSVESGGKILYTRSQEGGVDIDIYKKKYLKYKSKYLKLKNN